MGSQRLYYEELYNVLICIPQTLIEKFLEFMEMAYRENRTIFIFGNGGSASAASHFVQDLSKGALTDFKDQRRLRVISLCDNISGITAWSNDEDYACIFEQQLRNLAHKKDIAIAISGSGNSANVVRGIEYARQNSITTIAFTGYGGGKIADLVDLNIHVPSYNMGMVEAAHGAIMHYAVEELKERLQRIWHSIYVDKNVSELKDNGND